MSNKMNMNCLFSFFSFGISLSMTAKISAVQPINLILQNDIRSNLSFTDGASVGKGMVDGEVWGFNDVSVFPVDDQDFKPCFILRNKTPRSFESLNIFVKNREINVFTGMIGRVFAFSDQIYCTEETRMEISNRMNDPLMQLSFNVGVLPNPFFNIHINGYWSENNDKYSYFTQRQKEILNNVLVELRIVFNGPLYESKLIEQLQNANISDPVTEAKSIIEVFRSGTKKLRPFMLACCSEGRAALRGDWFSITSWRYTSYEEKPQDGKLHQTTAHEISHNLGYDDSKAYSIGYAARETIKEYYKIGKFKKGEVYYER